MPSRQPLAVPDVDGASASGARGSSPAVSKLVLWLAVGGGFSALVLLLTVLWIVYQRLKASRTNPYDLASVKQLRRYTYRQLKAATGSFSEAHRLGQGGFGTVYHGVLRSGQPVAVKKLDASSLQGEREFQNEVSVIGCLHSPHIVTLLGFCVEGKRRLLVYDFMANRSLQEALFDDEYPITLGWDTRFKIILDTAQGLAFLHLQCDPPIIHGDVKPSNILLDANLSARIADFGLARLKVDTAVPDPGNEELEREALERERIRFERAAREKVKRQRKREETERKKAAADAAASATAGYAVGGISSPNGTPLTNHHKPPPPYDSLFDDTRTEADTETVDLSTEDGKGEEERRGCYLRQGGAKSEGVPSSGELSIGDYILEWRTNDSARRARSNGKDSSWRDDSSFEFNSREFTQDDCRKKGHSRSSDGWVELSGELIQEPLKKKEVGRREGREWWKDEHLADTKCKADKKDKSKSKGKGRKHRREWWKDEYSGQLRSTQIKEWWNREDFIAEYSGKHRELRDAKLKDKRRGRSAPSTDLGRRDEFSGELAHITDSRSSRRDCTSKDWLSGNEVTSRGVSSTPSMRGTICYVAPEYGGGGLLSEKSDVYSFGVLMLVIISGRRPLQVMASPIAELERANLISWARHLAQAGNLLDLVDVNFQGQFSKEQATLCIMVALLCLQRIPTLRPAMPDVVKILLGQIELPALPFDFSPSPPGVQLAFIPRSTEGVDRDLPMLS